MMMKRIGFNKNMSQKVIIKSEFYGIIVVEICGTIFAVDKKEYEKYIKNNNGENNEYNK